MTGTNLWDQQASNRRKSALLVAGFVLFFAWVGFGGDLAFWLATKDLPPREYHHPGRRDGLVRVGQGAGPGALGGRRA